MENKYILVSGNIGSGKTTFAKQLGNNLGFQVYLEPYENNPYLNRFYENMREWSFKSQVYFLSYHLKQHLEITNMEKENIIKDCSIYESVEIFGKNVYKNGNMSEEDWETYYTLYLHVLKTIRKPDLIIRLDCPINTLVKRVARRGRTMESGVTKEYLSDLDTLYAEWIDSIKFAPVLKVFNDDGDYLIKGSTLQEINNFIR